MVFSVCENTSHSHYHDATKRKLTALINIFPLSLHGILRGLNLGDRGCYFNPPRNQWDDTDRLRCKGERVTEATRRIAPHVLFETS
jgi:hypothetical protein